MRGRWAVWAGVMVLTMLTWPAWAAPKVKPVATASLVPALPKGDVAAGLAKSESERCQECHGVDGHGAGRSNGPEGKFAKLAGQYPEYILKQIRDFRSGARKHDVMSIMANSIEDADVMDIAAYFASQRPMKGDGSGEVALGKRLYLQGDPTRGIAACASCHGADGKGQITGNVINPVIGGQEWLYLDKQLREWRSGDRRNSAGGVMNQVTRQLTDEELTALADYVSGL